MKQIRLYSWICCLTATFTVLSAKGLSAPDPNDLLEQSRAMRRQYLIQKASAVAENTPIDEEASLMRVIEQVMSLRTPALSESHNTMLPSGQNGPNAVESAKTAEPTITAVATTGETGAIAADGSTEAKTPLDVLRMLENKQTILYPADVADVLFRAGKINEAARFYEMALNTVDKDKASIHQWLLFQTANCLRHSNGSRAAMLYDELIRLYPNSAWAAAAQARRQILIWMETRQQELKTRTAKQDNDEQ